MLRDGKTILLVLCCTFLMFPGITHAQINGNLPLDGSVEGVLHIEDSWDYWIVTTTVDGVLELSVESIEAVVQFEVNQGDAGTVTPRNTGVSGNTRSADFMIGAGTYYVNVYIIEVQGEISYTLSNVFNQASLPNDTESNDSPENSSALVPNVSSTGHLGFFYSGDYDDVDWWIVTTTSDGNLKITTQSDTSELQIEIHMKDSSQNNLNSGTPSGSTTMVDYNVAAGTYYIKLNRPDTEMGQIGSGSYTVTALVTPASLPNDPEPNNGAGIASLLGRNSSDTGHLGYCIRAGVFDTIDYWKIVIPSNGMLTVSTDCTSSLAIILELYDSGLNLILTGNPFGTHTAVEYQFAPGTYYINARRRNNGQYGSYTITSSVTMPSLPEDTEPNDAAEEASILEINSSDTGHLGYRESDSNNYDTSDWWVITIPSNGFLDITATVDDDTLEVDLFLYDQTLEQLKTGDTSGLTTNLQTLLSAGVYYIDVHRESYTNGYGAYTIENSFTAASLPDDSEPNNTAEEALILELNGSSTGHLGFADSSESGTDTSDWWMLTTTSDGLLSITTTVEDGTLDIDLSLYDSTLEHMRTAETAGVTERLQFPVSPGTYYIDVQRKNDTEGFGAYTIANSLTVPPLPNDHEPNDIAEDAKILEYDTSATGHLGYYTVGGTYDTSDWWRVITEPADTLEIRTVSVDDTLEITLYLYDRDLTKVKTVYSDSLVAHLRYENLMDVMYYIQVERKSDTDGFGAYTISIENIEQTLVGEVPGEFHVYPPYPNPFNPVVSFRYEIPDESHVLLTVYDITGRRIAVLEDGSVSAGIHQVTWNGMDNNGRLSGSGVYFYRLRAGSYRAEGKVLFLR